MDQLRTNKPNLRTNRFERRIARLKKFYDKCARKLAEIQKAKETSSVCPIMPSQTPDDQGPSLLKQDIPNLCEKQSLEDLKEDKDSDADTVIVEVDSSSVSPSACDIPELKRTDSTFLTKTSLNLRSTSDVSKFDSLDTSSSSENADTECSPLGDNETTANLDSHRGSEGSMMKLKKTAYGKRMYNKKQYCFYCSKPVCKMARHLAQVHNNEVDVVKAFSYPKGSKERRINLDRLRNKGNTAHITHVFKSGKGLLMPRQQSMAKEANVMNYMHCLNCQGLIKRKALWRHMSRCKLARKCQVPKPGRSRVQALCAFAEPVPENVSKTLWNLIGDMKKDEVTCAVKSDTGIIKFGEHLCNKMGNDKTKHEYIRNRMRQVGRLLVSARKMGKLQSVKDFFIPANFYHVISAVKETSRFRDEDEVFGIPSLALKLGQNLQKMSDIAEREAMIAGDENVVKNVIMFQHMYATKWNELVSTSAMKTLNEAKCNSPELLPFTEDVKKMHIYLSNQIELYQEKLQLEKSQKNWTNLAQVTLCDVIAFNRRRAEEVSKMRLSSFLHRNTFDLLDSLSEVEKKLCQHFQRVEIRVKRDRKVPILLTPRMLDSMELLVKNRQACGVLDENLFFFAIPMTEKSYYKGTYCIRMVALQCGAKHPNTLSSTKLRKHIATLSKVLNLKETELDLLVDFMGHDVGVHRKFNGVPEETLQLAMISKVLMALEQGRVSEFKGKNLDEMNIDPNEKVNVEDSESEHEEIESEMPLQEKRCQSSLKSLEESPVGSNSFSHQGPSSSTEECSFSAKERESPSSSGVSRCSKRKWTEVEVNAVENKLLDCITSGRVPGKRQCEDCIRSAPVLLKNRTWESVKFYIENRIIAFKRDCEK